MAIDTYLHCLFTEVEGEGEAEPGKFICIKVVKVNYQ